MGSLTVDTSWVRFDGTTLITGVVILVVGVVLLRVKPPLAHLFGAFVTAAGVLVGLGAFPAVDGSLALLLALIVLAVALFRVDRKSLVVWGVAIVVAIFTILAIFGLLGTFSSNTPLGQAYAAFLQAVNTLWSTVFHQ